MMKREKELQEGEVYIGKETAQGQDAEAESEEGNERAQLKRET